MMNEYNILLRVMRWVRRFRKRQGYGVHSPFAFDFITGVIYNAEAYYAYERLRQPLAISLVRFDEYDALSGLTAKDLRLLFRIANWAEPVSLSLYGASPAVRAYITAARSSATLRSVSPQDASGASAAVQNASGALLVADSSLAYCDAAEILPRLSASHDLESCTIIVRGIHADAAALSLWEHLKVSDLCTVSFDLGRFGIVVKRPKVTPQHYVVNYF